MKLAVSLWRLFQKDRLFRWADVRPLVGLVFVGLAYLWLRRQRERHGWLTEPEVDVDLL
jgi:hypothetical protein